MMSTYWLHRALVVLAIFVVGQGSPAKPTPFVDLVAAGADSWRSPDPARWSFVDGEIRGATPVIDGAKTSPESSAFLVSKRTFGGDIEVSIDITFEQGRYLGVYLDYGQDSQSGIWMATGHPLAGGSCGEASRSRDGLHQDGRGFRLDGADAG